MAAERPSKAYRSRAAGGDGRAKPPGGYDPARRLYKRSCRRFDFYAHFPRVSKSFRCLSSLVC